MQHLTKNTKFHLTIHTHGSENSAVVPQWATGIETPCYTSATMRRACVFFYVAINAFERRIMAWCVHTRQLNAAWHEHVSHHSTMSMVAQAGQLSGWPVSDVAGSLNPVWAIAIMKIETFGDSNICYTSEVALWLRSQPVCTLNSSFCFWLSAVLTPETARTVSALPHPMNTRPVAGWLAALCCPLLVVFLSVGGIMRNTFRVDGYAVNRRGNTVGIHYTVEANSSDAAKMTAWQLATQGGYQHIRLNHVTGARHA